MRQRLAAVGDPYLKVDTRAAEEHVVALDPADDRLADQLREGHILHQQREGVAVDQVGSRDGEPERLACKVEDLFDRLGRRLRRIDLVGRVVEGQRLAVVVEDLV